MLTTDFEIESVMESSCACSDFCDGHYLDNCYCSRRMVKNKWVVGIKFSFNSTDLEMKHYFSHKLTSKLVDSSIISRKGVSEHGSSLLIEIEDHIRAAFAQKTISFLLWFKPSKKEGEEEANLVKGHISEVSIPEPCAIIPYGAPTTVINNAHGIPRSECHQGVKDSRAQVARASDVGVATHDDEESKENERDNSKSVEVGAKETAGSKRARTGVARGNKK